MLELLQNWKTSESNTLVKGELTTVLRGMGSLSPEERPWLVSWQMK